MAGTAEKAARSHRLPLHPALVHFPIVLWVASLGFDLAGYLFDELPGLRPGTTAAVDALALGLLLALPAMTAGLFELRRVPGSGPAARVLSLHLLFSSLAFTAYLLQLLGRTKIPEQAIWPPVNALCCLVLIVGAHYGAKLVYRHGVGVADNRERHEQSK